MSADQYTFGDERLPKRFWKKVQLNEDTGCWEWTAAANHLGYGVYYHGGRLRPTHRVAKHVLCSESPARGLVIDHLCRTPACCNPAHLEWVTQKVNTHRGASPQVARRHNTHCSKGHEYTEENTIWRQRTPTSRTRSCRACRDEKNAARPTKGWGRPEDRTHCVNGHEFTPENTYTGGGKRTCKACRAERQRRYCAARRGRRE